MSFLPLSHHNQPASPSPPPPPPSLLPSALPETTTTLPANDPEAPNTIIHSDTPPTPPPIPHPQTFAPYFTLLSNTTSSTTHHPYISYIFSSDNPDTNPITAFALRSLDPSTPIPSPFEESGPNSRNGVRTKERCILLDMDATGTKVLSAQSMSPDWAVTSTELAPAPTWDDRGGEEVRGERGLMLRIEGMEVLGSVEGGDGGGGQKRLEELVDVYERRMGELRRVVDAGAGVVPQSRDV